MSGTGNVPLFVMFIANESGSSPLRLVNGKQSPGPKDDRICRTVSIIGVCIHSVAIYFPRNWQETAFARHKMFRDVGRMLIMSATCLVEQNNDKHTVHTIHKICRNLSACHSYGGKSKVT